MLKHLKTLSNSSLESKYLFVNYISVRTCQCSTLLLSLCTVCGLSNQLYFSLSLKWQKHF